MAKVRVNVSALSRSINNQLKTNLLAGRHSAKLDEKYKAELDKLIPQVYQAMTDQASQEIIRQEYESGLNQIIGALKSGINSQEDMPSDSKYPWQSLTNKYVKAKGHSRFWQKTGATYKAFSTLGTSSQELSPAPMNKYRWRGFGNKKARYTVITQIAFASRSDNPFIRDVIEESFITGRPSYAAYANVTNLGKAPFIELKNTNSRGGSKLRRPFMAAVMASKKENIHRYIVDRMKQLNIAQKLKPVR